MKKYVPITTVLFVLINIFYSSASLAQQGQNEELKINIQLRPRAEFRNGLFTPILEGHWALKWTSVLIIR